MNPPSEGLAGRAATSPALFNRCVLNWFGDWNEESLVQVATEFARTLDIVKQGYKLPEQLVLSAAQVRLDVVPTYRDAVVSALITAHQAVAKTNRRLQQRQSKTVFLTPRHFLDFVTQFVRRMSNSMK
jgi:dynein heavy chain 1